MQWDHTASAPPNAPGKRDVLGTWLLSILAGHKRYAHITGLRGDALSPQIPPLYWSAQEQLLALHETHGLSGEALQAWCRERGLFAHHLTSWQAAFFAPQRKWLQARGNYAVCEMKTSSSSVNWCARKKPWQRQQPC